MMSQESSNPIARWCLYLLCGIIGVFVMYQPTIRSGFEQVQAAPIDTRLNHYFLEHTYQFAANDEYVGFLWSAPFFYPLEYALALSDNLLGTAPVYWALRMVTDETASYQWWMILVTFLTYLAAVYLARSLGVSALLSVAGAYFFAFGLPRIGQVGHPQLLCQCYTPLALACMWKFLQTPKTIYAAGVIAWFFLQLAAGVYLGWFLGIALGLFTVLALACNGEIREQVLTYLRTKALAWVPVCIAGGVCIILFMLPYVKISNSFDGGWGYDTVFPFIPTFKSWIGMNSNAWLYQSLDAVWKAPHGLESAHTFGLFGSILLLASLCALFAGKLGCGERRYVIFSMLTFLLLTVLASQWSEDASPWKFFYQYIPGAKAIRAVNRIWVITHLFLISGGLIALNSLIRRIPLAYARGIIGAAVLSFTILENIPGFVASYDPTPYIEAENNLAELIASSDVAYYTADPEANGAGELLTAMWAGIKANTRVVNGTSSRVPAGYPPNTLDLKTHQIIDWLGDSSARSLCMIYPENYTIRDSYLTKPVSESLQPVVTNGYKAYTIELPLEQIYGQRFVPIDPPSQLPADSLVYVTVAVQNTGSFVWPNESRRRVHGSYRWKTEDGTQLKVNPHRTQLPRPLTPYEWVVLDLTVQTPSEPGRYELCPTMVWEHIAWFESQNTAMGSIPVEIVPK